jgi:hypothetical protein
MVQSVIIRTDEEIIKKRDSSLIALTHTTPWASMNGGRSRDFMLKPDLFLERHQS